MWCCDIPSTTLLYCNCDVPVFHLEPPSQSAHASQILIMYCIHSFALLSLWHIFGPLNASICCRTVICLMKGLHYCEVLTMFNLVLLLLYCVFTSSHLLRASQPRKGCFEVRDESGTTYISLLDMPRPFTKLKAVDFEELAAEIAGKIKA